MGTSPEIQTQSIIEWMSMQDSYRRRSSNQEELSSSYCCLHSHKLLIHQYGCWNHLQYIWMNRDTAGEECDTSHRSPQILHAPLGCQRIHLQERRHIFQAKELVLNVVQTHIFTNPANVNIFNNIPLLSTGLVSS